MKSQSCYKGALAFAHKKEVKTIVDESNVIHNR